MDAADYRRPLLPENRNYRITTFRILGGLQICFGLLCGILSIAGVSIDGVNMNNICPPHTEYYYDPICDDASLLFIFDLICLLFSGWFLLTGFVPFFMTEGHRSNWRCLKITFMVLCIIGATTFIPTVFFMGIAVASIRGSEGGGLAALPAFLVLLSFAELIVAIVAASFCCCCPTSSNRPGLVITTGISPENVMSRPPAPTHPYTTYPAGYSSYGGTAEQQQNLNSSETEPPPYKE